MLVNPLIALLENVELGDDKNAAQYVKDELVYVTFATADGQLISREGPNQFRRGDALISTANGDKWSVSRNRFDAKYGPLPPLNTGDAGSYRSKPIPVLAKQIPLPFAIARSKGGDVLHGLAHDWLLQYAPGDYGIVGNDRFQQVYRLRDS